MKCIIDTNVPVKAADTTVETALDIECAIACLQFIDKFMKSPTSNLVIDYNGDILKEYEHNTRIHGQDTIATQFYKWIQRQITLRADSKIEFCHITKNRYGSYVEFPDSVELQGFDVADHKFVALASVHPDHPTIIQGADSLWWGYKEALGRCGVHIHFVCENYVKTKYEESHNAEK